MTVDRFTTLTEREIEILRLYPEVGRNRLIARRLGVTEQTMKNHIGHILRKLGCASFGQAVVLFDRHDRSGHG